MSTEQMNPAFDSMQRETGEFKPYPPSFVDGIMRAVKRLPIPYWLTYLLLFVLQSIVFHILAWADGWVPAYTFSPLVLVFPLWLWGPLAIMTYLNSISLRALTSFRPLMEVHDETIRRLEYEFSAMPRGAVILSAAIWAVIYLISTYVIYDNFYVALGFGTTQAVIVIIEGLISYSIGSAIYYHSYRQLRLVNRTVSMVKHFDMFRLDPVYAFSTVTSQTGMAWVLLLTLTLLLFPIQFAPGPALTTLTLQLLLAIGCFVLPLWNVHQRLVLEKRKLQAEHAQRVKTALAVLNTRVREDDMGDMVQMDHAIMGLVAETAILEKIPTWPWRSGVLTGFLSVVVLPIILFLVQLLLGRLVGK